LSNFPVAMHIISSHWENSMIHANLLLLLLLYSSQKQINEVLREHACSLLTKHGGRFTCKEALGGHWVQLEPAVMMAWRETSMVGTQEENFEMFVIRKMGVIKYYRVYCAKYWSFAMVYCSSVLESRQWQPFIHFNLVQNSSSD
jgi:hypothetical protein